MSYYWVGFSDRAAGCIEAPSEEKAIELANGFGQKPEIRGELSYPASPQLVNTSGCPDFCYMPEKCAAESKKLGGARCWPNVHRSRCCCN